VTQTNDANERLEVRSSRLWALFHFNLTRLIFPARMIADRLGISTNTIDAWYKPWDRSDEHLPMSHLAQVIHDRGLFWDSIRVESTGGGSNPLPIDGVSKSQARYFVEHMRERMNESPATPRR
jgi:hypothetical protein